MKISNENEVAAYHVIRVFAAVIFVLYILSNWIFPEYFGLFTGPIMSKVGAVYALIYLLTAAYLLFRGGIWFIEFMVDGGFVEFKYYYLTTPFSAKRMVRICVDDLYAYKEIAGLFGLRKKLILYQERKGKIFQYPPIPVGSFIEAKRKEVLTEIAKYAVKI